MKAYKDFIVSPIGERYNNSTKVGDKELILNTEVFNHQYVNRLAKVIATPILFQSPINVGDEVIVHHNVFRRWHDVKGREKNSRSYLEENKYLIQSDQIFLYKNKEWKATPGYSFIKPLKSTISISITLGSFFFVLFLPIFFWIKFISLNNLKRFKFLLTKIPTLRNFGSF